MSRFTSQEAAAAYLAGMIDGEGCVSFRCTGRTREIWSRRVEITNTDYDLIEACADAAAELGIQVTISERKARTSARRPAWNLHIHGRENFERLAAVPLQCFRKREALREIISTYLPRPPAAMDLLAMRARLQSNRELARELGVSHSTADRWLARARVAA